MNRQSERIVSDVFRFLSLSLEAAVLLLGLLIHRSEPHFRQCYTSKVLGNCFFRDHIRKKKDLQGERDELAERNRKKIPNHRHNNNNKSGIIISQKESDFFLIRLPFFGFDSAEQTINGNFFARLYLSRDPDGLRESSNQPSTCSHLL